MRIKISTADVRYRMNVEEYISLNSDILNKFEFIINNPKVKRSRLLDNFR